MASYLVNVNIHCQYEVGGLFGQPSFWLSAFNGKKFTNAVLARIFVTLNMFDDRFWSVVSQNALLLNFQCRPRCTVRTFNSLHASSLGMQYGLECVYDTLNLKPFHLRRYLLFITQGHWRGNIYSSCHCSQAIIHDRVWSKFRVSETRSVYNISNWQFLTTSTPMMGTEQVSKSLDFDRPYKALIDRKYPLDHVHRECFKTYIISLR